MKLAAYHCSLAAPLPVGMLVVVWLVASGVGLGMFWQYKTTGREPLDAPVHWPEPPQLPLAGDRPTLIMFAHPHCSCTAASLHELRRILQDCPVPPRVVFVIYQPANAEPAWRTSPFVEAARALSHEEILWDEGGTIAKKFAATTSGQVQLYHPRGQCLFNGGITWARGHVGENTASQALLSVLQGQETALIQSPIYGCEL